MARWHQFSIRHLLLLTALLAVFVVLALRRSASERAVDSLQSLGAAVALRRTNAGWLESVFRRTTTQVVRVKCEGPRFGDAELIPLLRLPDIRSLSLAKSRITDDGLARLSHLTNLESLYLSGTEVSEAGLKQLVNLKSLRILDVSHTRVGNDLKILERLPALVSLNLAGTAITDASLLDVQQSGHLRDINLRGTQVTRKGVYDFVQRVRARVLVDWSSYSYVAKNCDDAALADLEWMRDLRELTLDSPTITDSGLRYLKFLPHLYQLKLVRCAITDDGLLHVGKCRELTRLTMHGVPVSNKGMAHLSLLSRLEVLEVSGLAITDGALQHFADLNELRLLVLSDTQVSGIGVRQMKSASKRISTSWICVEHPSRQLASMKSANCVHCYFLICPVAP